MSRTFTAEVDSPLTREELKRQILTQLSVPLGKSDYRIESETESGITYARSYRPYAVPAILLCWLVVPLLLLLVERTDRIVFSIGNQNGGTHLVVVGDGPRALRRWFEELERWDWPGGRRTMPVRSMWPFWPVHRTLPKRYWEWAD